MKKLLAFLLALLLPGLAAAESHHLSLSIDVDEELFTFYAKQGMQADSQFASYDYDSMIAAAVKILDNLALDITVQKDAAQLTLQVGGGELLKLVFHLEEDGVYLTSPMISEYALTAALPDAFDSAMLGQGMQEAAANWLNEIEPDLTSGVFSGDAFEGGTQCTTWVLSDMDIAALVSALATDELRSIVSTMLDLFNVNGSEVLAAFDEANDQVADADAYIYLLRVVTNDAGEFTGAALTIIGDQAQVATFSLGQTKKAIKLVIGLGLQEQNYWWEFSGKISQLRNITCFNGDIREWIADKSEAFSYVSETNAPLAEYKLSFTFTKSGNRYLWDGNISMGNDVVRDYLCSSSGTWIPADGSLKCSISLGDAPYEPLKLNIEFGQGEDIAPMKYDLKHVSASDPADAAQYEKITNQFSASFLARMIKLLPTDLLLTISPYTLPK